MPSICFTSVLLLLFVTLDSVALAQDVTAVRLAEDAVVALEAELQTMQRLVDRSVVAEPSLRRSRLDLLEAQLLLARLQQDDGAIADRMKQALVVHEEQLAYIQHLAERGVGTDHELCIARLCVLKARLRLARHRQDVAAVDRILQAALPLQQQRLERLTKLASRGAASQKEVALQRMRLAVLVGEKRIETGEPAK